MMTTSTDRLMQQPHSFYEHTACIIWGNSGKLVKARVVKAAPLVKAAPGAPAAHLGLAQSPSLSHAS